MLSADCNIGPKSLQPVSSNLGTEQKKLLTPSVPLLLLPKIVQRRRKFCTTAELSERRLSLKTLSVAGRQQAFGDPASAPILALSYHPCF